MQLWSDPLDGLDPTDAISGLAADDAPWNWVPVGAPADGGKTRNPPNRKRGWRRWYFTYERPDGSRVRVSADKDPETGQWFNPHLASVQP